MYIVASIWEVARGKKAEAEALGKTMRARLIAQSGVEAIQHYTTDGNEDEIMVIVSYTDEAAYNRIINDPNGPFQTALKDVALESMMTWKQSWRGTAAPE